MDVEEAIRGRRSIRKFRPNPVPEELLREILDVARWSPSWRNTQAWTVWAVSGEALQRFKAEFAEKLLAAAPSKPDLDMPGREFPAACMDRTQRLMDERGACELAAELAEADLHAFSPRGGLRILRSTPSGSWTWISTNCSCEP